MSEQQTLFVSPQQYHDYHVVLGDVACPACGTTVRGECLALVPNGPPLSDKEIGDIFGFTGAFGSAANSTVETTLVRPALSPPKP